MLSFRVSEVMLKQHDMVAIKVAQHLNDFCPAQICDIHHVRDKLLIQVECQIL